MDPLPLSDQVSKRKLFSFLRKTPQGDELMGLLGKEVCDPSFNIEREGFPFVVVEFVEHGCMDIILDNEAVSLKSGGLLCYGPGSRISMKVSEGRECTKHFIAICPGAISELESFRELLAVERRILFESVPVIQILKFVSLISDLADDAALWEVLRKLVDALGQYIVLIPKADRVEIDSIDQTYLSVTRFISENFMSLKSLEEVAERCGYEKSYLCRLYKRNSNVSPYQQLIRMKMEYACVLLETTDWTVTAIANALAFEDPLHFSRVFKKKVGVSPSQFRPLR